MKSQSGGADIGGKARFLSLMPPRLNKRQQREQEELAALRINSEIDDAEEVNKGSSPPEEERAPAKVSFAAVGSHP